MRNETIFYGVQYPSNDYWNTQLLKIIATPIKPVVDDNDESETVYAEWSDYHREYKITEEETDIKVLLLPYYDECSRIDA